MVRVKNRYLLFEVSFEDSLASSSLLRRPQSILPSTLSDKDVQGCIRGSVELNFGDFGVGAVYGTTQGEGFVVNEGGSRPCAL